MMMEAAPRRRTSCTSTVANDDEADGASAGRPAALVVMRGGGDHDDDDSVVPDDMERVFAFDYDVLYKNYVRNTIILLTIWGLNFARCVYLVVTYYYESREQESAASYNMDSYDDEERPTTHQNHSTMDTVAAVLNGFLTACVLVVFVHTVCNISQRWRMEVERRLTVTTTGVRLDYPYRPSGPPLTLHIPFSVIYSIRRKSPPRCCSCLFASAAPSVIVLHDPPAGYIFRTCCSKITTTIADLVEPDEFVSLVQRRCVEMVKDHHHPQEKAAYSICMA